MFDPDDPPQTYKEFRREIKKTIESLDLNSDEYYQTALFLVDRKNQGTIVYAETIYEAHDGEITSEEMLYEAFPECIKKYNSKYFAFVMEARRNSTEEDILILITSWYRSMEVSVAVIDREDDEVYLEDWEKMDPEDFHDITRVLRQAIVLQG